MSSNGTFGYRNFTLIFAAATIVVAGAQSEPGGRFDVLTKIVRKNPVKTTTTTLPATTTEASVTPTAPAPSTSNALYPELSAIPSNFDASTEYDPVGGITPSNAPDDVGAFRFICTPGQIVADDPIAFPNQPGRSHLHQFFGNTEANASSTYSSLRTTGNSTCMSRLNRSAYWMPAMLDGKGSVVRPNAVSIYYKRMPLSNTRCSMTSGDPQAQGNCIPLPNGLRFIFGYDMLTGKTPTGAPYFNCAGPTAQPGHYATITEAMAHCPTEPTQQRGYDGNMYPVYNQLGAVINAPVCWDGKNLDSPNHRDHMSDMEHFGYSGWMRCPATHPFLIPTFTMGVWYTVDANLGTWHLASDEMHPELPAGSTFHADWFGAWDNDAEAKWMAGCINKMLNCSSGDLGTGQMMHQSLPFSMTVNPRLVPIPQ